ncbi:MAG TPA: hypothetical protein VK427_03240, partial [Kofleriaceae bacterium]|nr:hypothetical protein [Kofleriaceae bacterium]
MRHWICLIAAFATACGGKKTEEPAAGSGTATVKSDVKAAEDSVAIFVDGAPAAKVTAADIAAYPRLD